ncbi:hypothetical protein QE152_g23744 [Popillia japonica]|uniref:Uncharacterized protein n=1 Tax=Popillia japonica TaxID=7064 RepID=A0AAW1KFS1_POPJA
MAYRLAETLQLKHTFDHTKQMAEYDWLNSFLRRNPVLSIRKSEGISVHRSVGLNKYDWLNSFLRRNPVLSIRKSEGISVHRSVGLNKESVENYFKLLEQIMTEHQLFDTVHQLFDKPVTSTMLTRPDCN